MESKLSQAARLHVGRASEDYRTSSVGMECCSFSLGLLPASFHSVEVAVHHKGIELLHGRPWESLTNGQEAS